MTCTLFLKSLYTGYNLQSDGQYHIEEITSRSQRNLLLQEALCVTNTCTWCLQYHLLGFFFSIPWEPHFFIFYFYNYSCFLTPFEHVIVLWTVDMPLHIDTGHINILLNSLHVFWFFFKMHVYWNKLIVTTTVKCVII